MNYPITAFVIAGLTVSSASFSATAYDFKPGLWQITSTHKVIEVDAPPSIEKIIRETFDIPVETDCIKDITTAFNTESDDEECKTTVTQNSVNEMAFTTVCTGLESNSKAVGVVTLNGDEFSSKVEIMSTDELTKMTIEIVGSGKYMGACK